MRPAAFFCAVVPPCFEEEREEELEPDFLPPRLEAPGELAIFAARSFDMPFSFSFSYCFSFFTFELLLGIWRSFVVQPYGSGLAARGVLQTRRPAGYAGANAACEAYTEISASESSC